MSPSVSAARVLVPRLLAAGGLPPIPPDQNGLPGGNVLTQIIGGAMFWGLGVCVLGFLGGAATLWVGNQTQHYGAASLGRRAMIGGFVGAICIGGAIAVVNFGLGLGVKVHA